MARQHRHHAPADLVAADQRERPDRDRAAELVGDHRRAARIAPRARRPRRRVGRSACAPTPPTSGVSRSMTASHGDLARGAGRLGLADPWASRVAHHHRLAGQLAEGQAAWLDRRPGLSPGTCADT